MAAIVLLAASCWSAAMWGHAMVLRVDLVCGIVSGALLLAGIGVAVWDYHTMLTRDRDVLEQRLDEAREHRRYFEAQHYPGLQARQRLYREDAGSVIEQYQSESLKYRKIHNRLQSVIIVGSLSTTTVAALEDAVPGHRWVTVGVSFAVGLAAGFTGYFKFRERSFYLQQTADAVEQEANAMTLRVGEYRDHTETEALTRFVERVEYLRNEQRRRQQQLDQPQENQGLHSSE